MRERAGSSLGNSSAVVVTRTVWDGSSPFFLTCYEPVPYSHCGYNAAAAVASKKVFPANFEDFEVVDGLLLEKMIKKSGVLLTCKLDMIKSRTTSLGTNFSDYTKMRLASEEDLDDLIETTDKEYLIQVNRWLVRTSTVSSTQMVIPQQRQLPS